jgi:chloramphenicol 3-O-phosphotransferase
MRHLVSASRAAVSTRGKGGDSLAQTCAPGQIIILNVTPRSGKSSIVDVIQDTFDGVWMNLGVDRFMQMTPAHYLPGMGLRPAANARTSRHSFRSFIARFMSPSPPTAAWG